MLGLFYTLLLRLYPRRFRDEFAREMRAVFEDVLTEATDRHLWTKVAILWRELYGLPRAVVVTHLREWRQVMGLETRNVVNRYIPWWAMLAAVALFVDRARNVARRSRRVYLIAVPLVAGLGVWSTSRPKTGRDPKCLDKK